MNATQGRTAGLPWPPVIAVSAIAIAVILNVLYPLPWLSSPLADILFAAGWVAIFFAATLIGTAVKTLLRSHTTLNPGGTPDHLAVHGPYSFTRNPMYLGLTLTGIGIGLVTGIAWFLPLALIAAYAITKVAIEPEEKTLAAKFGKRYRDYAKKVRRWV